MALHNYLVHLPSQNCVVVDIDVEEQLNERVNGGYSDDDGDYVRDFDDIMRGVELEMSHVLVGDEGK